MVRWHHGAIWNAACRHRVFKFFDIMKKVMMIDPFHYANHWESAGWSIFCWASRGHTFHTIPGDGCDDHCSTWGIFNSSNSFNSAIWIQVDEKNNPPLKGSNHMTYHSPGFEISPGLRRWPRAEDHIAEFEERKRFFFRVSEDCEFMYTWRVRSYMGKEDVCLHSVLKAKSLHDWMTLVSKL